MPCRLNADVHERINEVPTVLRRYRVKLHRTEQCTYHQQEKKSPRRFTTQSVIAISGLTQSIVRSDEALSPGSVDAMV